MFRKLRKWIKDFMERVRVKADVDYFMKCIKKEYGKSGFVYLTEECIADYTNYKWYNIGEPIFFILSRVLNIHYKIRYIDDNCIHLYSTHDIDAFKNHLYHEFKVYMNFSEA